MLICIDGPSPVTDHFQNMIVVLIAISHFVLIFGGELLSETAM